jgi:hypothetical protein
MSESAVRWMTTSSAAWSASLGDCARDDVMRTAHGKG